MGRCQCGATYYLSGGKDITRHAPFCPNNKETTCCEKARLMELHLIETIRSGFASWNYCPWCGKDRHATWNEIASKFHAESGEGGQDG